MLVRPAVIGVLWALGFVVLESIQFVFFGHIFQRMSAFLFGFLVFAIACSAFIGWAAVFRRGELCAALGARRSLISANLLAAASWAMFLTAVQIIEPAVAYTLGAGAMPLTAWLAHRLGVAEGEPMRNRAEAAGNLIIALSLIWLAVVTIGGWSGFVRGGSGVAVLGVALALAEGALFTWLLIHCQRLDRAGVGPATLFGLRFMLYAAMAGALAAAGVDYKMPLPTGEIAWVVAIGLVLIVPPLYALQRAIALVSTLTLSAITALGPFVIFALQAIEGRVDHSWPVLIGLFIYFAGALLAAWGAVKAAATGQQTV